MFVSETKALSLSQSFPIQLIIQREVHATEYVKLQALLAFSVLTPSREPMLDPCCSSFKTLWGKNTETVHVVNGFESPGKAS